MTKASQLVKVFVAMVSVSFTATAATTEAVKYTVDKSDFSIKQSLTGKAGDPVKGRATVINRKKGNCLACHAMPIPEQAFHGRIAPPLVGVGGRYTEGQLRLRVVNPKVLNPHSIMPAYYKADGYNRPIKKFAGKTILGAQDVEDIVAYLTTLK
jgi:sulfur-oxidizing protein SoxX